MGFFGRTYKFNRSNAPSIRFLIDNFNVSQRFGFEIILWITIGFVNRQRFLDACMKPRWQLFLNRIPSVGRQRSVYVSPIRLQPWVHTWERGFFKLHSVEHSYRSRIEILMQL